MSSDFRPTVLILGASDGGLATALELAKLDRQKKALNIVLIDQESHRVTHQQRHQHLTRSKVNQLHPPRHHAKQQGVYFVNDIITAIAPHEQSISLHNNRRVGYDYLVVALDSQPKKQHLPGVAEFGHSTYSRYDTARLRHHLKSLSKPTKDLHRVVIGGAGPIGIELAHFLSEQHHYCNGCNKKEPHFEITLIEQNSNILGGFSLENQQKVLNLLEKRNIQLYLNTTIKSIDANRVYYEGGHSSPYDLFIWAGGYQPHQHLGQSRFALHDSGRVSVNPYLQARGYSRIYAVGDSAFPVDIHPTHLSHAQSALDQAKIAAYNVHKQVYELPLKQYKPTYYSPVFKIGNVLIRD